MAAVEDIYNFLALSERIGTAGQPTADEFAAVKAAGYDVVINLLPVTAPDALPDEERIVSALCLEYVPVPVDWQHPAVTDAKHFFDLLDARQVRRIFVHCAANKRVSVFMYLYRTLRENVDAAVAVRDVHRIWEPNETWQCFMENLVLQKDRRIGL